MKSDSPKCTFKIGEKVAIALLQAIAVVCFVDAAVVIWKCIF